MVQPTKVELEILNVLWKQGSSTVREVHDALQRQKDTNYATTVKMLAIMHAKGLVSREQSRRPQQYKAAITQKSTQKKVLRSVVEKLFSGSTTKLVLQALSDGKNSDEELEEIRVLVAELQERDHRKGGKK